MCEVGAEEVSGVGCDGGLVLGAEGPEVVHGVALHFGPESAGDRLVNLAC